MALASGAWSSSDRRLLLSLAGAVLLLVIVVAAIAPSTANNEPRPSTYNTAPGGAKAAYETLEAMGWNVARWDRPLDDLRETDAAHTTVVLAAPLYTALDKDRLADAIRAFLERGGRLVTSGAEGALLIPGGATASGRRFGALCFTRPEGPGSLARAGEVEMAEPVRWSAETPASFVEQRCGPDAAVVRKPVGHGEAIWWSSPSPVTNAELHNDGDLRLLLASLGPGRRVLFDESLQEAVSSKWSAARGLPLRSLLAQAALIFGLLIFSFSRRRGPIRLPVSVPRSSPLEFATSMGDLYEKAGATGAATEAARRRLERVLVREAGLAQGTVRGGPDAIVAALESRFGGEWASLGQRLRDAATAADVQLGSGSALALVRALAADAARLHTAVQPPPALAASDRVNDKVGDEVTVP